jgi:hypothetical protein
MIRKLQSVHQETLAELRQRNNEIYLYDIRIVDNSCG